MYVYPDYNIFSGYFNCLFFSIFFPKSSLTKIKLLYSLRVFSMKSPGPNRRIFQNCNFLFTITTLYLITAVFKKNILHGWRLAFGSIFDFNRNNSYFCNVSWELHVYCKEDFLKFWMLFIVTLFTTAFNNLKICTVYKDFAVI